MKKWVRKPFMLRQASGNVKVKMHNNIEQKRLSVRQSFLILKHKFSVLL